LDKPTKVTVFDVDYVIAKINTSSTSSTSSTSTRNSNKENNVEVIAMVDYCTHKGAALSEGRITSTSTSTSTEQSSCSSRSFQCSYHGWLFDSKTGECIDIPQVETEVDTNTNTSTAAGIRKKRDGMRDIKTNGRAVPAMIDTNGMVWIFPGGGSGGGSGLEEALLRPPPPVEMIPEIGKDGFRPVVQVIRDFPIDWTILLENIMDPDHGLFAHQEKSFDLYSASKNNPISIREQELDYGNGWTVTSQVDATYELCRRNEDQIIMESEVQEGHHEKRKKKKMRMRTKRKFNGINGGNDGDVLKSTITFVAPNMVFFARRNKDGETKSVSCFFITPTGTGRSRFMSCTLAKAPKWLKVPRFFVHIFINNFLDQDTYLLATQQRHVLATESQLVIDSISRNNNNNNNNKNNKNSNDIYKEVDDMATIPVRKKMYTYRSPTDRLGMRVGNFFDATISRVPNRLSKIRNYGGYNNALEKLSFTRREVLDRKKYHTLICKDSMGFVKNCQTLRSAMKVVAFIPILLRVMASSIGSGGSSVSSAGVGIGIGMKLLPSSIIATVNRILSPSLILLIWTVSFAISFVTKKLEKEFEFKYTEEFRDKDNAKIPSVWMDLQ